MLLEAATFIGLAMQCSSDVAPDTLLAIARQESGLRPLVLHNNNTRAVLEARSPQAAAAQAREWIALGHSVDLGLMQVNSNNLVRLGIAVEAIFDPCKNIAAGSRILQAAYGAAAKRLGEGNDALRAALSAYNTGDERAGLANGYVESVEARVTRYAVPSIGGLAQPRAGMSLQPPAQSTPASLPLSPMVEGVAKSTDIFVGASILQGMAVERDAFGGQNTVTFGKED